MNKHWNDNLLCAVNIMTSGPDADTDQLLRLALIPVSMDYHIEKRLTPFNLMIKPYGNLDSINSDWINKRQMKELCLQGISSEKVKEIFILWFEKFNFRGGKKILPLSIHWPDKIPFLKRWLGDEIYSIIFHEDFRDLISTANFLNDKVGLSGGRYPYPKLSISGFCNATNLTYQRDDFYHQTWCIIETYSRILRLVSGG